MAECPFDEIVGMDESNGQPATIKISTKRVTMSKAMAEYLETDECKILISKKKESEQIYMALVIGNDKLGFELREDRGGHLFTTKKHIVKQVHQLIKGKRLPVILALDKVKPIINYDGLMYRPLKHINP